MSICYSLLTKPWMLFSEGEEDIGNYDEASIRYRGKNIPSKSFQKLQSMTGGPGPESNFLGRIISADI